MQRTLSINREGVVNLEALSAVPEEERLRVAKALVAAAYELIPKRSERDDMITPAAFELATVCNSAGKPCFKRRLSISVHANSPPCASARSLARLTGR